MDINQIISVFSLIFASFTCIFSIFSLYYSLKSWTSCEAMRLSTHTVQYAPVDKEIEEANQEWATKQESLKTQDKAFQEDVEDEMPEFAVDDDDREIYSF